MSPAIPPADQVHVDLGALAQRVTGTERAIDDVNGRLDGLGTQLNGLASSFGDQMRFLGEKIDKRLERQPTNWIGVILAAAALFTVGTAVMVPVFNGMGRLETKIEQVADTSARAAELRATNETMRSRDDKLSQLIEGLDKDKIGVREHDEFKANISGQLATFERTQDSRFLDLDKSISDRLSAIISRLDALSARINEVPTTTK